MPIRRRESAWPISQARRVSDQPETKNKSRQPSGRRVSRTSQATVFPPTTRSTTAARPSLDRRRQNRIVPAWKSASGSSRNLTNGCSTQGSRVRGPAASPGRQRSAADGAAAICDRSEAARDARPAGRRPPAAAPALPRRSPPTAPAEAREPRIGSRRFDPIGGQKSPAIRAARDSIKRVVKSEQIVPRRREREAPPPADALQIDQRQPDRTVGEDFNEDVCRMQIAVRETVPMQPARPAAPGRGPVRGGNGPRRRRRRDCVRGGESFAKNLVERAGVRRFHA